MKLSKAALQQRKEFNFTKINNKMKKQIDRMGEIAFPKIKPGIATPFTPGVKYPKQKISVKEYKNLPHQGYRVISGAKNKYGAIKQEYKGGMYHSKMEARYAQDLDLRKKAHDIKNWKRQEKIRLDCNGFHICNYYIDFTIEHNDGLIEFVEVKGMELPVWRIKWKLMQSIYGRNPNYKLTVVK